MQGFETGLLELTEDHDGWVMPEPLHILLGLDLHGLREGIIGRVLLRN